MMEDLEIKRLDPENIAYFEELIELFAGVFEMGDFSPPERGHLIQLLAKDDFHVFIALKDGAVIGGLTAYTLNQYYSMKPLAYIFDLAVLNQWQRMGVGKQLIIQTKHYFQQNGYEEVFVQADKADGYAIDFYRKTYPAEEEDVLHFNYRLNER